MAMTPMPTTKTPGADSNSILSLLKSAAECHETAAACHEQAAEHHRTAAKLYAAGDNMKAGQNAKRAAEHCTQAEHNCAQAMHHSHLIEATYSGPNIVSPTVGHQPLGQTTKM